MGTRHGTAQLGPETGAVRCARVLGAEPGAIRVVRFRITALRVRDAVGGEVLGELGLDAGRIAALRKLGVV